MARYLFLILCLVGYVDNLKSQTYPPNNSTIALLRELEADGYINQAALVHGRLGVVRLSAMLDSASAQCDSCKYITRIKVARSSLNINSDKDIQLNWIEQLSFSHSFTNQESRTIESIGLDLLNAELQPLLMNRYGRNYNGNYNWYFESTHSFHYRNKISLEFQPQIYSARSDFNEPVLNMQRALLSGYIKNLEISLGRDNIVWGNRYNGGLLFSSNAPPLDFIRLSSVKRFRLPGFLSKIGTFNASAFVADLGDSFSNMNAKLGAYRIDYQPVKSWTVGLEHSVTLGGEGVEGPGLIRAGGEFIGFVITPGSDAPSNHIIGLNSSLKIKDWKIFSSVLFEDTDANLDMFLNHNATWMFGVYNPTLGKIEGLELWVELIRSSPRSYGHGIYLDGHALDGKILGFEIGPNAVSADFTLGYRFRNDHYIQINTRLISRLGNTYTVVRDSNDGFEDLRVVEYDPNENHYIVRTNVNLNLSRSIHLATEFGIDYVNNLNFEKNKQQWQYMGGIKVDYFFNRRQ